MGECGWFQGNILIIFCGVEMNNSSPSLSLSHSRQLVRSFTFRSCWWTSARAWNIQLFFLQRFFQPPREWLFHKCTTQSSMGNKPPRSSHHHIHLIRKCVHYGRSILIQSDKTNEEKKMSLPLTAMPHHSNFKSKMGAKTVWKLFYLS